MERHRPGGWAGVLLLAASMAVLLPTPGARAQARFANTDAITIPDAPVPANPYPSTITVSGLAGITTKVTVTLAGVTHPFFEDIDVLLVGPGGQRALVMSDVGGRNQVAAPGVTLTFDDAAAQSLTAGPIVSGTFRPTNLDDSFSVGTTDIFPAPAPAGPYGSALSVFNGTDPNGVWQLFVRDDAFGEFGLRAIAGGWSLEFATATLTVVRFGQGTLTSAPAAIDCGTTCVGTFGEGSLVTLSAAPAAGFSFAGWSGGGCAGTGPCAVAMTADVTVTAVFEALPAGTAALTVRLVGAGTVISAPAGIQCGVACAATYAVGTPVTLSATAAAGLVFAGWSGGGCAGTADCVVVLNENVTVTATFEAPAGFVALTVVRVGEGAGSVTSAPAGIGCGDTCAAVYAPSTVVTLTATAGPNAVFLGFGGHPDCVDGVVTLAASLTCTATFEKIVALSPPSGPMLPSQGFDLVIFERAMGSPIVGRTATLDGTDVSGPLAACLVLGALGDGSGTTARCPNLTGALLGPGPHTVAVTARFADGSSATDTVTWTVAQSAGAPALTILPPTGRYALTQGFDFVLLVRGPSLAVGGTATLDGADVTGPLAACVQAVALVDGTAFRCSGLRGSLLGPGSHVVSVTIAFASGSSATVAVVWDVRANQE